MDDVIFGKNDIIKLKKEKKYIFLFTMAIFLLNYFPQLAIPIRYIVLPLLVLLLYQYQSFDLLIFPLLFLDDTIGTYIAGRITLLWFFFALYSLKKILNSNTINRFSRVSLSEFIAFFMCVYFVLLGFETHGFVYLKIVFAVLIALITARDLSDDVEMQERFQFMVICATLVSALSLTFGLGKEIEYYNRSLAFGFSDPNYSSVACCIGLSASLYIKVKKKFDIFTIIVLSLIYILGILRASSLTGIGITILIILSKVSFAKKIKKKIQIIIIIIALSVVVLLFLYPMLGTNYFDAVIARMNVLNGYTSLDTSAITSGRTTIAEYYLSYYQDENFLMQILGGNILNCPELFNNIGGVFVTHNVYLDHLMVFGIIGEIVMLYVYVCRLFRYTKCAYGQQREFNNMIVTIKLVLMIYA
ncbi:hypothetical protein, partial [Megasphaera cerevisiae]|uniref:hypothetical protein n=1 Tax=Megasphaera cerevisiae TaxID=39029 RepID=UPI001180826B